MLLPCREHAGRLVVVLFQSRVARSALASRAATANDFNFRFVPSVLVQPPTTSTTKTLNIPLRQHEHNGGHERIQGRLL
jgi:hypothetical protein